MVFVTQYTLILVFIIVTNIFVVFGDEEYMGEKFDKKYLEPENVVPTVNDFNAYAKGLRNIIKHLMRKSNNTESNKAIGLYFMKVVLKRTLRDYGDRLSEKQRKYIAKILHDGEYLMDHYHSHINLLISERWADIEYRLAKALKFDDAHVHSMRDFNRNVLKKWILSKGVINDFIEEMDSATLGRDHYAALLEDSPEKYHIHIDISDICLSRLVENPEPFDFTKISRCRRDNYCDRNIHASPSIAYSLSHRMVNHLMYVHNRRCYFRSPKDDNFHLDILCSFMYREAVYIAKRGFFARDMFMEHVLLCGMNGYEEFHRRNWFHKVVSWIDFEGCVAENLNFDINRTESYFKNPRYKKDEIKMMKMRRDRKKTMANNCHNHLMALAIGVLAHGIRHAARFML